MIGHIYGAIDAGCTEIVNKQMSIVTGYIDGSTIYVKTNIIAGCKNCTEAIPLYDKSSSVGIIPSSNEMYVMNNGEVDTVEITFCPICGRRLTNA